MAKPPPVSVPDGWRRIFGLSAEHPIGGFTRCSPRLLKVLNEVNNHRVSRALVSESETRSQPPV